MDDKEDWIGLKTIIRISSERYIKSTKLTQKEVRYYISSSTRDAIYFNKAVRQHWAIENNLHWGLDVIFDEDRNLKKKENSDQNFNVISKMALVLLEKEKSTKISKPNKRAKVALSDTYREKLLWG
ncbi:MAG: ISAs1 family transposase [Bacteroidales bacterium]